MLKKNVLIVAAFMLATIGNCAMAKPCKKNLLNPSAPKIGVIGSKTSDGKKSLLVNAGKPVGADVQAKTVQHPERMHRAAEAKATFQTTGFGFLDGPDGSTWFYTQNNVPDESGYFYTSSVVTVYDSKNELRGSFTVTLPENSKVNQVEPYGIVTTKLFDNKSTTFEVTVFMHEVTPDYVGRQTVEVYGLAGEKVASFDGDGFVATSIKNEWTQYQRFILVDNNPSVKGNTDIKVYRPASWGEEGAQLDHTFSLNSLLLNYMDAPFLNFFDDKGEPYYVIAHYAKSFDVRDENGEMVINPENYMPTFTPDNSFVIDTYDRYYQLKSSFSVSTEAPEDVMVRMCGIGVMSDLDITHGFFTGDDNLNYVIMYEDVQPTTEYTTSFVAYNQDGTKLGTIARNVGDFWNTLTDIEGQETQMMFLDASGQYIYTVDLPSFYPQSLPEKVDGYTASTNIDRYPTLNDPKGYRYVMGINEAETDGQGNVIAMFAYLNSDMTTRNIVSVNLGDKAQTFSPLLNNQSLDPYLFNTDDNREYIFFSKLKDSDEGSLGHNTLFIANDRGEILETMNLQPNNAKGDIWTAAILNYGTPEASLLVNYNDWSTGLNTLEFYSLPLTSFTAGGDGTELNPYLISTLGDLKMIERNPSAHYRLANGIDARGYAVSIPQFLGTLDGDGNTIKNLYVKSDNYDGGLFGQTDGATIKNIKFVDAVAEATRSNSNFGFLSGYSIGSAFEGIVVDNLMLDATNSNATPVGGIVGEAMGQTTIVGSLLTNSEIKAENNVGGIVGETRTSSAVKNTAVTATTVKAKSDVGGIVGVIGTGCEVADCYVKANVYGQMSVGAVAGSCGVNGNRGIIHNAVAENANVIDEGESHRGFGIIAGYLEPEWTESDITPLYNNVSVNSCIILPEACEVSASTHAIVGYTKANEQAEQGETLEEKKIHDNYVVKTPDSDDFSVMKLYFGGSDSDKSAEGKLLTAMPEQSFWEGLAFDFGSVDTEAAWIFMPGSAPVLPVMNTENLPSAIHGVGTDAATAITNGVYNLAGQRLGDDAKAYRGIVIMNGKKYIK